MSEIEDRLTSEMAVLREIASAVARERDVRKLLENVLGILERSMGMLRGTFTLLEGDELRIVASTRALNAEERALGRYHVGEGITGLVAKTGKAEVVCDVRKDRRFFEPHAVAWPRRCAFVCLRSADSSRADHRHACGRPRDVGPDGCTCARCRAS